MDVKNTLEKFRSLIPTNRINNLFFILFYLCITIIACILLGISTAVISVPLIQIYFLASIVCFIIITSTLPKEYMFSIGIIVLILSIKYICFIYNINKQDIQYDVFSKLIFNNSTNKTNNNASKKINLLVFIFSVLLIAFGFLVLRIVTNLSVQYFFAIVIMLAMFFNFWIVHYMNTIYIAAISQN